MLEILLGNLPALLTGGIALLVAWKYLSNILAVLKEVQELIVAVSEALADKSLTKEEIDSIVKEWKDIPEAIKNLIKKEE